VDKNQKTPFFSSSLFFSAKDQQLESQVHLPLKQAIIPQT
jgi:hypothetical protein